MGAFRRSALDQIRNSSAASTSPNRLQASQTLDLFREKNIYHQLAQLATARKAIDKAILRMLFVAIAIEGRDVKRLECTPTCTGAV